MVSGIVWMVDLNQGIRKREINWGLETENKDNCRYCSVGCDREMYEDLVASFQQKSISSLSFSCRCGHLLVRRTATGGRFLGEVEPP